MAILHWKHRYSCDKNYDFQPKYPSILNSICFHLDMK